MATIQTLLETYGKQIDVTITHGETTYTSEDLVACNISFDGQILTSIMKQAEIELDGVGGANFAESMKGERIKIQLTVTAEGETATRDYGTFIVKDAKYNDDYNSVSLTCYDLLLLSMQPYKPVADFTETVTLGSFLAGLCSELAIPLATPTFTNSTVEIDGEKYNEEYTFRDVLTEIAQAAGGIIAINNDQINVLYPAASGVIVEPSNLKSLTVGEQYGTVNSVVIARTPQEDNIYQRDETADEWIEIKIENNQLMDSHREDFLNGLYTALSGLTYYPYEITSFGIGALEIGDLFTIETLDGTQYPALYTSGEIEIGQGFTETTTSKSPDTTKTEYSAADTTERKLNQTILRVNKQDQTIESLVSTTTTKTNELTGKVDQLTQKVSQTMTSEEINFLIEQEISGKDSITTSTGYKFDADGLYIRKSDDEIENKLDNTGMYVNKIIGESEENILTANTDGVNAINLTARKYLTIGTNSRFEDYEGNRTACFWIGE